MMKRIIFLALFLLLIVGCAQQAELAEETQEEVVAPAEEPAEEVEELSYTDITPQEAKNMMDNNPDLIVIDVSPDYEQGHLPGAVNYYLGDGSLDAAIPELNPDADYLVYCHVESASRAGAQKLVDAGFMNVYRLAGEYDAWVDAGFEVEQ